MQQHSRDVLKDVTTALQLEQELQLSLAQHGVTVLDVYSSEWGNTKALSETFRRLYTDAGDQIHLRFYSVECNSVLESLNFPEEQRNPQRQKNLDLCRETLPAFWEPILKSRRGKSKPYFVFYKEGRQRALIEGIDTPKIINCVRELCRIQKPANECTSNAELLKFWERYFSAAENEVFWESFVRAILDHTLSNQTLTDKEEKTFAEAIGVKDSSKVSLEELEKWIGENGTIDSAFAELFPFLKEEANISAVSGGGSRGIAHLERADPEYNTSKDTAYGNAMEGRETLPEAGSNWRPELWHCVAVLPLHCPSKTRLVLLSTEKGEEEAKEYAQRAVEIPTLNAYLTDLGFTSEDIQVMCHSAAEKIPSLNLSYGKLAMTLVLSDSAKCDELLKRQEGLFEHLSGGTLMTQKPSLAYTLICLCTSDAQGHYETIYYSNDASTVECTSPLNEGDEVVLLPFSRLSTDTPTEGAFAVKFVGMPQVIPLPATADSKGEAVVLSPWYCKFHVTKREENGLTLTFAGFMEEEMFHQSVQSYTEHLMADEGKLAKSVDVVGISERPLGTEHQSFILSITDPHLLDKHNTKIPPPHEGGAEIPPPHEGSAEIPPPHEGSAEIPPPHEGSAEIPPPHEGSAEIPPPHEGSAEIPPPHEGSAEIPPPHEGGAEIPPPHEGSAEIPPPHEGSAEIPPPHEGSAEIPPPHEGSAEIPPPHEGSAEIPPPHEGSAEIPPPHEGSAEIPPPHEGSAEIPPPHEGSAEIPPPHEGSAEIPPPHEGSAEIPPPHEGSAEIPPPHEGSAEIPPPHEEGAEIPPPHEGSAEIPPPHERSAEIPPPHEGSAEIPPPHEGSAEIPPPHEGSAEIPPPHEGSAEIPPPHEGSAEIPPPHEGSAEIPPPHEGSAEIPPPHEGSAEIPPPHEGSAEIPPPHEGSAEIPPPHEGSAEIPPPHEGSAEIPPPHEGSAEIPPPHEGSAEIPPPHEGSAEIPPPHEGSAEIPPPHEGSAEIPPPHEGSAEIPPPHEEGAEIPPPHEGSAEIPPPHEGSAEIPPPHEGSAEIPPPHEGSAEIPPPHEGSAEIPPPHEGSAEIPPPHESPVSVPNDAKELSEDDVAKAEEREPLKDVAEI